MPSRGGLELRLADGVALLAMVDDVLIGGLDRRDTQS